MKINRIFLTGAIVFLFVWGAPRVLSTIFGHKKADPVVMVPPTPQKPLIIISGLIEQIPDGTPLTVPGGVSTNGTPAVPNDLETTTIVLGRMINLSGIPTVVCDDGSPVPTGGETKGFVHPALDVTTCAATFAHNITSCTVTFHAMKVEVATGVGPTYSWAGSVLTITRAPTWTVGDFDYDCSFAN